MKKACDALAKSPIFRQLNHDTFGHFCNRLSIKMYYKGEMLANEGDECQALGIVLDGQVALQKYSFDGEFTTLDLLGTGDVFGEDLIFSSRHIWPYSIEAVTHTKIIMLTLNVLIPLFQENPEIIRSFMAFMSDRIQEQNQRIMVLSQRTLRGKISNYLLDLYTTQLVAAQKSQAASGSSDNKEVLPGDQDSPPTVVLPVSKEVVSRLLAMPRPSLSRELVKMEKDGLIHVDGRSIELLNLADLERGRNINTLIGRHHGELERFG
ncbi:MAG TPA: Crp/Fnr family transcriptional regulator [Clostridiaceae bacterium]|nr:Crp/Fnr family transcriptional regulator [Clostridiaceae bacterium]